MWHDVKLLNAITNMLLGLVLLILLASGLWWLAQRPMFTLKTISVEGAANMQLRRVNALTIRASAVPRIKGNFFTADLEAVRVAFESVPWVRRAMVRREWPNKLMVTLEEHRALGTWGHDGRLLSVQGDVFTANLAEAEDDGVLLDFAGPEGSEKEVVARFHQFSHWFAPIALAPQALALSHRYAWTVKLDNGMTVQLGRAEGDATLQARIARLVSVYPQLQERLRGKIENLDMRYPNGLALKAEGLVATALNGKKK